MSGYAKFMKVLVTKKRAASSEQADNVHHCRAIATRSLGKKWKIQVYLLNHAPLEHSSLQRTYAIWERVL